LGVYPAGDPVGSVAKYCLVVFTVLHDEVDTKYLQDKKHQEIKVTAEKKKDITHRVGNI
jgi:hypothetical protein